METASIQLFVYGSLRRGFRNPAYEYIAQFFHFVGEATVKGKLYLKDSIPVAVPTLDDSYIKGELYILKKPSDFNWAFGQLDDYEGVGAEPGEHPLYKREISLATCQGTDSLTWIYWYNRSTEGMPVLDTEDLLDFFGK